MLVVLLAAVCSPVRAVVAVLRATLERMVVLVSAGVTVGLVPTATLQKVWKYGWVPAVVAAVVVAAARMQIILRAVTVAVVAAVAVLAAGMSSSYPRERLLFLAA